METMPRITKLRRRLEEARNKGIERVIQELFEMEKELILKLQTEKQLYQGVDAKGNDLEPPYAESTKAIKRRKGQPTNRVTLKDTGDFYDAMDVSYSPEDFQIINYDEKFEKLSNKYGADLLGLNEKSRELLKERLRKRLQDYFKNELT